MWAPVAQADLPRNAQAPVPKAVEKTDANRDLPAAAVIKVVAEPLIPTIPASTSKEPQGLVPPRPSVARSVSAPAKCSFPRPSSVSSFSSTPAGRMLWDRSTMLAPGFPSVYGRSYSEVLRAAVSRPRVVLVPDLVSPGAARPGRHPADHAAAEPDQEPRDAAPPYPRASASRDASGGDWG